MELTHHAYLLVGDHGATISELKLKYPNCRHQRFARLGIDDSRALVVDQGQTAWDGDTKLFLLEITDATVEAQNALLKVLEEPTAGTHFVLIVPSAEILLPTVRSRLQILQGESTQAETNIARELLAQIPAKRLEWLKNNEVPTNFLDQLEQVIAEKKALPAYAELALARRYWHTPGVSHKLLLEHLAVNLPIFVLR